MLVSDIDEPVVAAATRTPFEARRRVFVIERAETMNDQAANRMLKTLEEPADFAHLVLLTDRPGEILPTIASRCQHVRFDAPSADEIAARLHGIEPTTAQACARLGLGDAERAARLAFGDGPKLRAGAEAYARGALHDELAQRPWLELLVRAKALGDEAQVDRRGAPGRGARLPAHARPQARRARERRGGQARRAPRACRGSGPGAAARRAVVPRRRGGGGRRARGRPCRRSPRRAARGRAKAAARTGCARAVETVDDARALLILNPSEELLLEALAYRLARELGAS